MNIPTTGDKGLGLDVIARTLQAVAAQLKKYAFSESSVSSPRKNVEGGISGRTYGKEFMLAQAAKYIETFRECPKKASGGSWHPVTAHCAEAIGGLPCARSYVEHFGTLKQAWREAIASSGAPAPLSAPYGGDRPSHKEMIEWVRQYHARFGKLPETSRGKHTWTEETQDNMLSMGQVVKYHWVREVFGRRSALWNAAGFKVKQRKKTFKAPAGSLAEIAARELSKPRAPYRAETVDCGAVKSERDRPVDVTAAEAQAIVEDALIRQQERCGSPQVHVVMPPKASRRQSKYVSPGAIVDAAVRYYRAHGDFPKRGLGNHWHPRCEAAAKACGMPSPGVITRRYRKLSNAWAEAIKVVNQKAAA